MIVAFWTEGRIGTALTLLFGFGAGATMVWPDAKLIGLTTMAGSLAGLAFLVVHQFTESRFPRPKAISSGIALLAFMVSYALLGPYVERQSKPTAIAAPASPKIERKAFCFAGFRVSHKNREIGVVALLANSNKEAVRFIYMGGDFALNGFPPALQVAGQQMTIYPEQRLATMSSKPVKLGRDFPAGTEFEGTVDFQARYGPTTSDTALIRVRGKIFLKLGPSNRQIGIDQEISPEGLNWCDEQTVDAYANQPM